ncbi:hypothetical protein [Rhizobium nepotum]|uniref:hypothetical protein n=1 Tax=Rhizobium nepotum TaxID=1035271 RepID=UPI003CE863B0
MKRVYVLVALGLLTGCQSATGDKDISSSITEPKLRAQLAEDYQQRQVAIAAMEANCRAKWAGDPSMVAYCEETQTPVLRRFVSNQVRFKHMNKNGLFEKERKDHLNCRAAFPGDFEMAQACVDNETAMRRLARRV